MEEEFEEAILVIDFLTEWINECRGRPLIELEAVFDLKEKELNKLAKRLKYFELRRKQN
jgi:hypothetical protein